MRILTANEGFFLYNENAMSISDKVYLGIYADETEWVEITEEEKERLEAEWGDTDGTD